jgi:transcriptional regulator with XRE-family HTH domain
LQDPEVLAGYLEMAAELELMQALDEARKQLHMTQEQLATLTGKKREAISRLFSSDGPNPTLETIIEFLSALNLTADITLRPSREGEGPMKVVLESPATYQTAREG